MRLRDTLPTVVLGLFFTRIVFAFLSGTVKTDYVFVRWTGPTWAPVIYIAVIVLSWGIFVFDGAPRWGRSLREVGTVLTTTFAFGEGETFGGALKRLFVGLWRPFLRMLVILFLFVGLGVGFLLVGYGMFDTGGEIKVYHLGLAMALFAMLLLVVWE